MTLINNSTITCSLQKRDDNSLSFSASHSSGDPYFETNLSESERAEFQRVKNFLLSL